MSVAEQLSFAPERSAGFYEVDVDEANDLLTKWDHYLGPCNRPFGQQAWMLSVGSMPVAVAVSASAVPPRTAGRSRKEIVELARLCAGERWATRVMLRLWREVAMPAWPYWEAQAAIAYCKNDRHDGRIYRFDGWTKVNDNCGSSGGGAWSRRRYAGDAAHGRKTLWEYVR